MVRKSKTMPDILYVYTEVNGEDVYYIPVDRIEDIPVDADGMTVGTFKLQSMAKIKINTTYVLSHGK